MPNGDMADMVSDHTDMDLIEDFMVVDSGNSFFLFFEFSIFIKQFKMKNNFLDVDSMADIQDGAASMDKLLNLSIFLILISVLKLSKINL